MYLLQSLLAAIFLAAQITALVSCDDVSDHVVATTTTTVTPIVTILVGPTSTNVMATNIQSTITATATVTVTFQCSKLAARYLDSEALDNTQIGTVSHSHDQGPPVSADCANLDSSAQFTGMPILNLRDPLMAHTVVVAASSTSIAVCHSATGSFGFNFISNCTSSARVSRSQRREIMNDALYFPDIDILLNLFYLSPSNPSNEQSLTTRKTQPSTISSSNASTPLLNSSTILSTTDLPTLSSQSLSSDTDAESTSTTVVVVSLTTSTATAMASTIPTHANTTTPTSAARPRPKPVRTLFWLNWMFAKTPAKIFNPFGDSVNAEKAKLFLGTVADTQSRLRCEE